MMNSYEVPAEQWAVFCDRFSRDHHDWPVTIEVLTAEIGSERLAEELPLDGLSFDTKGTRPSSLEISAGDSVRSHVAHTVDLPLRIWVANDDSDNHGTVKIEPADGPPVLVHYHQPG
jgi:hypothetical protein